MISLRNTGFVYNYKIPARGTIFKKLQEIAIWVTLEERPHAAHHNQVGLIEESANYTMTTSLCNVIFWPEGGTRGKAMRASTVSILVTR